MSGLVNALETAMKGSSDENSEIIPTGGLSAMLSSNMNVKYRGCYESLYNFLFPLVALKVLRDAPSDGAFQDMSKADKTPGQAIRIPSNKMIYKKYPGSYGDVDLNYIVRPNFDCAYNAVYMDLQSCPVVITIPTVPAIPAKFTSDGKSRERFWNMQLMDAWTNNYVEIGMQDDAGPGQYVIQGFTQNKNDGPVYNPLQSYNIALILLLVIVIIITASIFFSSTTTGASTVIMSLIVGVCLLLIVLIAVYGKKKYMAVYQCPTNFSYLIIRIECVNVADFEENLFSLQRQFTCSYINPNKCSHKVNQRFNTEMHVPASFYISNPCMTNDDCPMDQFCVANSEYGGYCKTYATDCVYTADCNPMQYCNTTTHLCTDFPNCTQNSDCDKGEYCDMAQGGPGMPGTPGEGGKSGQPDTGVCRLKQHKSKKQLCTSDLDCSFTGFCNEANNQCEARPCFQNMDCPTNQFCNTEMVCESMEDAKCKSDTDCMGGQYCNASDGRCENMKTKCATAADCNKTDQTCDTNSGTCALACTDDSQCPAKKNEYCDTSIGACTKSTMKCNSTSDCVDGYGCVNGTCKPIPTTCNPQQVPVVPNNVSDEDEADMMAQLSSPGPSMPGTSKLPATSKIPIPYPSTKSDGQCAQGYECTSDGQCEQVACVPGQSDSPCTTGNICDPSTMTCSPIQSCQSDKNCSMGQTCESGTCTNTPCTTTEGECVVGSYCDPNINYCVPVPTPSGLSCTNDASCAAGMYCNRNLTPAQCAYTTGYSPAPTNPPGILTEPMVLSTNDIVFNMSADYFYTLASEMIRTVAPLDGGYQNDQMSALLKTINMIPINNDPNMNTFEWNNIPTGTKMGLSSSVRGASRTFAKAGAIFKRVQGTFTHWSGFGQQSGAAFGADKYLIRALEAATGLGLNGEKTAVYYTCSKDSSINFPHGSNTLNGGRSNYTIHFAGQSCISKIMAPPVQAFWSITVYTNQGYPVPNAQNIYSFGTHSGIVYETDGSIMLYMTIESAYDPTTMHNWLPIPESRFSVTFRAYVPDEVIINQSWIPPYINKISECNAATIKAAFSNTFDNPNVTNVAQCIQSLNINERQNLYKNIGCQSMKQVIAQCQGYGNAENSDVDTSPEMILYGMNPDGNDNNQARFYQDLGTQMNPMGPYPPAGNPYNKEGSNDAAKNYEKQRREEMNKVNTNTTNTILDAAAPMAGMQNPEGGLTNLLNNNSKLEVKL